MMKTKKMMMKMIFVVDVMMMTTDNDEDDEQKMDDEDDDFDDVHAKDVQHCLEFVNQNTYVEMDEDLVVPVRI